jgi:hypothetical protein
MQLKKSGIKLHRLIFQGPYKFEYQPFFFKDLYFANPSEVVLDDDILLNPSEVLKKMRALIALFMTS